MKLETVYVKASHHLVNVYGWARTFTPILHLSLGLRKGHSILSYITEDSPSMSIMPNRCTKLSKNNPQIY